MAFPKHHNDLRFQAYVMIFIAGCMFLIQSTILYFNFGFNLISILCLIGIGMSIYAIYLENKALGHIKKMDALWLQMEKMEHDRPRKS